MGIQIDFCTGLVIVGIVIYAFYIGNSWYKDARRQAELDKIPRGPSGPG